MKPTIVSTPKDNPADNADGVLVFTDVSIGDLLMCSCNDADDGSGTPLFTVPTDDDTNMWEEIGTKQSESSGPYQMSFATRATAAGTVTATIPHTNEGASMCSMIGRCWTDVHGSTVADAVVAAAGATSTGANTARLPVSGTLTITDIDVALWVVIGTNSTTRELRGINNTTSTPVWSTTPSALTEDVMLDGNDVSDPTTWTKGLISAEQDDTDQSVTFSENEGDTFRSASQMFVIKGLASSAGVPNRGLPRGLQRGLVRGMAA